MELTKNIFFNTDKLVENTKVKISYTGKLFQENSEKVFIHYGFGLLWDNLAETQMEKTDIGFQAEIELPEYDTLNFCFRDDNGNWDNNQGQNYVFQIEKNDTALILSDIGAPITSKRRLRKTYIWSKKIRLAIYKLIVYVPKIISGNYKRKLAE